MRRFQQYQELLNKGGHDVEQFTINGSLFLGIANHYDDAENWSTDSFIYKMNPLTKLFFLYQTIDTYAAGDLEYFSIANNHYLAVASYDDYTYPLDSAIFQWNGSQFVPFQSIATNDAGKFTFFEIKGEAFLAVTNYYNGSSHFINSVIYKWNSNKFEKYQEIPTEGAFWSVAFEINNELFIVFANYYNFKHDHSVNSIVLKWSDGYFSKFQSLQTYGAAHVKSFDINGDTFLAFANYRNGTRAEGHNIDSFIYKWNGSKFDLFQSIPTRGAFALYPFIICGQTYLTAVNYYDGEKNVHRYSTTSDVYQFNGEHFIKYQEIPTQAAIAVTKFDFKNQVYLVIVSYYNEIENKYRINSNLFRWI